MTGDSIPSRDDLTLASTPQAHPSVFAHAFNTGEPDLVERLYEPAGILISGPGRVTSGRQRREANERLTGLGVPIEVRPRHVYVADDLALLIVDWSISGTARDGARIDLRHTATDVARRGVDGRWRYVIDNPFGTAVPRP